MTVTHYLSRGGGRRRPKHRRQKAWDPVLPALAARFDVPMADDPAAVAALITRTADRVLAARR
jgi:hypothetical protein